MLPPPPAQPLLNGGLTPPQRPNARHRQAVGFFPAFSKAKSAGSGQVLSPLATPNVAAQQHLQPAPEQWATTPPPRTQASIPSKGALFTAATPNPDAAVPRRAQPPPSQQTQQLQPPQPMSPQADSPFALGPVGVPLHPELRSVLRLNGAHQQKVYYSGRLSKRVKRGTDGKPPTRDEGWIDVWCQLSGVMLSIWNMEAIEEANAQGEQVPPQYICITNALIQVLESVLFPATPTSPAGRFTNVFTLNSTGSNLLLFVCDSPGALVSWAAALRLASWEKSRLEEIYTGHLLRMILTEGQRWKEPHTSLAQSKFKGWARVRIAGQMDWKRLWVVVSAGSAGSYGAPGPDTKKDKTSGLFPRRTSSAIFLSGKTSTEANPNLSLTNNKGAPVIYFYTSAEPKERTTPTLTVSDVSQTFAVYPERPDLIARSTLVKVEGRLGWEEGAGAVKGTEAWVLVMPEAESGQAAGPRKMLELVVAFHDAFRLYGRPTQYSFDTYNAASLMFAYPTEPSIDQLFLDREDAESLDPREDATSITHSRLTAILQERIYQTHMHAGSNNASSFIQTARRNQPTSQNATECRSQNATQHSAENESNKMTRIISGLDHQPSAGVRGPTLTPATEQTMTSERSSPPVRIDQQQQNNLSVGTGEGAGSAFQPEEVSANQEQSRQRHTRALRDGNNGSYGDGGEARESEALAAGEGQGAWPTSTTLGAMNIENPGPRGANLTAQEDITASEATRATPSLIDRQSMLAAPPNMGFGGPCKQQEQLAPVLVQNPSTPELPYSQPSIPQPLYTAPEPITSTLPPPITMGSQARTTPCPIVGHSYSGSLPSMNSMMMPMMNGMWGMPNMSMIFPNPMIGGFDPQHQLHMWIAQQAAAETYQRTMMALSQGGSARSGQTQENGRAAMPISGQWGMMGMGMPWMGMNPMMTGGGVGMGMMPSGFGGPQFGVGMSSMDMQGMDRMGSMSSSPGLQEQDQNGPVAPTRDSEGPLT
ncbi:hypothetical protein BDV93DRAFT_522246 [Ceratobasidium sp. AG-I]|nr:hypothetical protein BDV93DRAFT_522246 [Ceratobasidium sp. AG-I]